MKNSPTYTRRLEKNLWKAFDMACNIREAAKREIYSKKEIAFHLDELCKHLFKVHPEND